MLEGLAELLVSAKGIEVIAVTSGLDKEDGAIEWICRLVQPRPFHRVSSLQQKHDSLDYVEKPLPFKRVEGFDRR